MQLNDSINDHIEDYEESMFDLIGSYFQSNKLEYLVVRHQLESYDYFVQHQAEKTVQMFNPVIIESPLHYNEKLEKSSLTIKLNFVNYRLQQPYIYESDGSFKLMFPNDARTRGFNYSSKMIVDLDISYIIRDVENMENEKIIKKEIKNIEIGKMPIMVKSSICMTNLCKDNTAKLKKECPMDCGGYFIIKGSEKIVLAQERSAENNVCCYSGKNSSKKWLLYAEIKCVPDNKCISPKHNEIGIEMAKNEYGHSIFVKIPRVKQILPIFVMMRTISPIELSDETICQIILGDLNEDLAKEMLPLLHSSILDGTKYRTKEKATAHFMASLSFSVPKSKITYSSAYIHRKKLAFMNEVLEKDLLPHCKNDFQKLYLLGYIVRKLLLIKLDKEELTDRDSYINKRIDLTGAILNNLLRNFMNKFVKESQKLIIEEIEKGSWKSSFLDFENIINNTNVLKFFKNNTIENGLKNALSTGDFSITANTPKSGVAQLLNRTNYPSSLSQKRRINTPIAKSGELIAPRKLHSTTWGYFCPAETPEGQSIGLVKNLSYMCHITNPCHNEILYKHTEPFILQFDTIEPTQIHKFVKIFVNGSWIGVIEKHKAKELYDTLKQKKFSKIINIYTSIVFDYANLEIKICADGGRLTRPLHRIENKRILLTNEMVAKIRSKELGWDDLLTNNKIPNAVIEYLDPVEQANSLIYLNKSTYKATNSYTHSEIHPSTIFGLLASCIPFPERNQAPRNTYQCAMGKQAIGIHVLNYKERFDKTFYVMDRPTKPLVTTRIMEFTKMNELPAGVQITVAIMSYTGYNQEDSVLINKGSIDRGLFRSTIYHTEKEEDKTTSKEEIKRCKPNTNETSGFKLANYSKLESNGFVKENTRIEKNDVIMGKIMRIKKSQKTTSIETINLNANKKYEDLCKVNRSTEPSYIDKNYYGKNGDGYYFSKIRLRIHRDVNLGDKFSSRHGQKGTCGRIIPEQDMPYTAEGLRPDIIINPHAIPSRMTIAHLTETIYGKLLVQLGMFGDATAFGELDIDDICDELLKNGFERHGNEMMYDGITGTQLTTPIFIGSVYYQRLKHMVKDKQHSRSTGPSVALTRQPAEGRSRDGGFRIGEMERDVMIAHGISNFCHERLFTVSDKYECVICKNCGLICRYNENKENTIYLCNACENKTEFAKIKLPYACKLLFQELQTINAVPRLITE